MRGPYRNRAFAAQLVLEWLRRLASSSVTVARIAVESFYARSSLPAVSGDKLVILGSGPSLQSSLAELKGSLVSNTQFMSVNDYFKERSFKSLEPAFHVIADPIYWDDSCFEEYAEPLLRGIQTTDWKITLFLPTRSRRSKLHQALMSRGMLFSFYSTTPLSGFRPLVHFAFSQRLGMPKAQNVLVSAIAVALWLKFRSVTLLGADHSWHQEIEVDVKNTLLVKQIHSYDDQVEMRPFYKPRGIGKLASSTELESRDTFSMKEILRAWATMHESYEQLSEIAKSRDVSVFNSSAVSFIDAFERKSIAEFVGTPATPNPGVADADLRYGGG
jgi:hypothetical protein